MSDRIHASHTPAEPAHDDYSWRYDLAMPPTLGDLEGLCAAAISDSVPKDAGVSWGNGAIFLFWRRVTP